MGAGKRTTLAVRLFDLHPIYHGISAGALAHLQVALRLALDSRTPEAQKATIRRMFKDGSELLGWLQQPREEGDRCETVLKVVRSVISLPSSSLSSEKKIEFLRAATKRSVGRPPDSKLLTVYALEVKAARPKTKWKEVTELLCVCRSQKHDSCCEENLKSQVKRLKSLLNRTGLTTLIVAKAKHQVLKSNLRTVLSSKA